MTIDLKIYQLFSKFTQDSKLTWYAVILESLR